MLNDGNISKPCLPNFLPNFWSLQLLHEHIIDALRCHKICWILWNNAPGHQEVKT